MDWKEQVEHDMYAHLVGRQMFCPQTGKVLDVRTAVVVETPDGERVLGILSPEAWEKTKEIVLGKMPKARVVINGVVQTTEKEN